MNVPDNPVRNAIERSVQVGSILRTPTRGSKFSITAINQYGIRDDKSKSYTTWQALDGIIPYVDAQGGVVKIGATNGIAEPGSLESYLRNESGKGTRTANYVAAILAESRVVEYVMINGSSAMHIRLLPPFSGN